MSEIPGVRVNGRVEIRSFLKDLSLPESKEKIDRLGETLATIFALERKKMEAYRNLWRIYLADCKRLGIEPRQANITVM